MKTVVRKGTNLQHTSLDRVLVNWSLKYIMTTIITLFITFVDFIGHPLQKHNILMIQSIVMLQTLRSVQTAFNTCQSFSLTKGRLPYLLIQLTVVVIEETHNYLHPRMAQHLQWITYILQSLQYNQNLIK